MLALFRQIEKIGRSAASVLIQGETGSGKELAARAIHARSDRRAIFIPVTAVLSNIVSNVPAVMLLRNVVAGFPEPDAGWLALAMASTLAGNLTITGSVANIIVVEQAAAEGVEVRFREYFRIGLPVTALTLAFGTVWLWMSS